MNIIYLGPYRQNNLTGIWSKNILSNLIQSKKNEDNITTRPIYYERTNTEKDEYNYQPLSILEHNIQNNYDCLVQHVKPDSMIVSQFINKNICIPILNSESLHDQAIANLQLCDMVLVDDILNYHRLSSVLDNVYLFHYSLNIDLSTIPNKINVGIYENMTKIYFIGNYEQNKDLYEDIIISFIKFSQLRDNVCLVLFPLNGDQHTVSQLQNFASSLYSSLRLNNPFNKVVILPISATSENIISCHKTGDIYLNINDDIRNSSSSIYAYELNNKVIESYHLMMNTIFYRNEKMSPLSHSIPTQQSLVMSLNISIETNLEPPNTIKESKTIGAYAL